MNGASRSKPQTWVSKREGAKADRDLLLAESCRRQGQSRRPADRDLVDAKFCRDVIRDRLNNDTVDGGQRAQFDEILHLEKTAYRSERRDNQQPVVDIRIFDSVNGARAVKRNSDACAILADNASRDGKRTRFCRRRVGNIDNPGRTVGFEARHARTCKLDAHDRRAILATLKQYFPHAVVIVRLKCGQIDLRGAVEYEPERVGTLEDRGGRRRSERQFEPQPVTRLLRASDHDCIRVGLRPNGVIGCSDGW